MTLWLLVPLLGLIAILQTTLVPRLAIAGFKLDLPLLVVVAWGLIGRPGEAAAWGFIAGIFLDLMSGLPFGTHTLALTGVGLVMGLAQSTIFHSNVILPPAAVILATLGHNVIVLGLLNTIGWPIPWNDYLLRVTLPTALLNTLALPIVYFPLPRLHRRLRPQVEW
ncbi:MAG: rod shape-determining protein MreD [Chloroflexi bacterium]|nr:rod shape-determining protein MreD [Chloroflexota bacterium]